MVLLASVRIVTLFNSPNAGAFLQAFALGCVMEGLTGVRVAYVDTGARSPRKIMAKRVLASLRRGDIEQARYHVERGAAFARSLKALPVEPALPAYGDEDLIVFGSDEIWNVSRKNILQYPLLWGEGFEGGRKVAYAPSTNGVNLRSCLIYEGMFESLSQFEFLSARDELTASSLSDVLGRPVEMVCDPTLLLDVDDYRLIQNPIPDRRYLLVYSFGSAMSAENVAEITAFARSNDLELISANNWLSWCDENVPCAASDFLALLDGAEYVVTDTFHGSVFSALYGKRFASYARTKVKVVDFLDRFALNDHNPEKTESLEACLLAEPNYAVFSSRLSDERERSFAYLHKCVAQGGGV